MLDQRSVYNATRWRVVKSSVGLLDKEALGNAFVYDNNRNGGEFIYGVVEVLDHSLELGDFRGQHLFSHRITDTITVDDEVGGLGTLVLVLEDVNGFADEVLHFVLDNFLSLGLYDVVRVVLRHGFVGGSCKSNHGLFSRVAHVDTNEHGSAGVHHRRELHSK